MKGLLGPGIRGGGLSILVIAGTLIAGGAIAAPKVPKPPRSAPEASPTQASPTGQPPFQSAASRPETQPSGGAVASPTSAGLKWLSVKTPRPKQSVADALTDEIMKLTDSRNSGAEPPLVFSSEGEVATTLAMSDFKKQQIDRTQEWKRNSRIPRQKYLDYRRRSEAFLLESVRLYLEWEALNKEMTEELQDRKKSYAAQIAAINGAIEEAKADFPLAFGALESYLVSLGWVAVSYSKDVAVRSIQAARDESARRSEEAGKVEFRQMTGGVDDTELKPALVRVTERSTVFSVGFDEVLPLVLKGADQRAQSTFYLAMALSCVQPRTQSAPARASSRTGPSPDSGVEMSGGLAIAVCDRGTQALSCDQAMLEEAIVQQLPEGVRGERAFVGEVLDYVRRTCSEGRFYCAPDRRAQWDQDLDRFQQGIIKLTREKSDYEQRISMVEAEIRNKKERIAQIQAQLRDVCRQRSDSDRAAGAEKERWLQASTRRTVWHSEEVSWEAGERQEEKVRALVEKILKESEIRYRDSVEEYLRGGVNPEDLFARNEESRSAARPQRFALLRYYQLAVRARSFLNIGVQTEMEVSSRNLIDPDVGNWQEKMTKGLRWDGSVLKGNHISFYPVLDPQGVPAPKQYSGLAKGDALSQVELLNEKRPGGVGGWKIPTARDLDIIRTNCGCRSESAARDPRMDCPAWATRLSLDCSRNAAYWTSESEDMPNSLEPWYQTYSFSDAGTASPKASTDEAFLILVSETGSQLADPCSQFSAEK